MKHSLLHVFALSSLSLTTCTLGTFAWVFPPITTSSTRASSHRISSSSSSHKSLPQQQQQQQQQSEDDIKHDIEVMHQQAMERLNQLSHRMEELYEQQTALEAHEADHPHQHQHHARTTTSISSSIHQHTEKATHDKIQARNVPSTATTVNVTKKTKAARATKTTTTTTTETTTASSSFFETPVDTTITTADNSAVDAEAETSIEPRMDACPNLLDDTTWKIAMDIHREQGTWMPEEWGKSDEHCRCQVVVDFTSEPVCYEDNDDFFMDLVKNSNNGVASVAVGGSSSGSSSSSPVKVLKVDEAWIYPHGVGRESVGQRPLPVEMEGAYKVALGQGPFGTHVIRFCLTVTEDVRSCPESDIYIPAGRIYGTLGYYPQHFRHTSTVKDKALAEYQEMVLREAELQRKSEEQQDGLLSIMDQVKRFKELWGLRKQMEKQAEKVREARQRDPDRHQLRLSRQGNVGLSREGGLCCKVQNGVAMEYRIIGKMEVGSVDFHHYHHSMDEAHNLHP